MLEPKDDFMFFLENSSSSYVNVDAVPHAQSTIDVPVVPVSPIIDMISSENTAIPSPFVKIDSFDDIDSQSILIFLLLTVKEKEVALYIHYITSCLMHIFPHNIVLLFSPLILILFPSLFQMSYQI